MSQKSTKESGSDGLPDRLCDSACSDINKPDFRELDLGSPVSPLRTRSTGLATAAATSSSSSSSSGSVTGRIGPTSVTRKPDSDRSVHSGNLSASTGSSPKIISRNPRGTQTRSDPGPTQPLIYSGQSSATSAAVNMLPAGNILPRGTVLKTGMATSRSPRTDVLGSGTGTYGHGNIMRGTGGAISARKLSSVMSGGGGSPRQVSASPVNVDSSMGGGTSTDMLVKKAMSSRDAEEVKRVGNELYKKGNFSEALRLYDRALVLSPGNAAYRSNRAAALTGLNRVGEAIKECEEALKFEPNYTRAHQRLASLFLRMGQIDNASKHHCYLGNQSDPAELQKLQVIDTHMTKCADARLHGDWKTALKEADTIIAYGVDFSPQLVMCKVEALLKLNKLDDAKSMLSQVPKVEPFPTSCSQNRFSGMLCESYMFFVKAQIELALGRFESAVTAAEKAGQIDPQNKEVSGKVRNIRMVARARNRGNDLYKSERYTEACSAYEEGLRYDPSNAVLFCNRAACWFKRGMWDHTIKDCNQALIIQPNYTKPLLRRAASYAKLERWADAARDYEALKRELPDDKDVAESLFHTQVALRRSRGEDVSNMKFGGEVEEISSLEQLRAVISLPGVSIVYFVKASDSRCKEISPFVDTLCIRYPSLNFLKVDIDKCPDIGGAENAMVVPTFKIYKKGCRVKEIICPNHQVLEHSVRHYSL